MKIDLLDLELDVHYDYEPPSIGCVDESGRIETLSATISIFGVVCKGINILPLLTPEQVLELEEKLLEEKRNS